MSKFCILCLILSLVSGPAFAVPKKILVFGDSLASGYGLRDSEAFPVILSQRLQADGYEVVIVNACVPGNTTAMGIDRVAQATADKPDLVILELGTNDLLNKVDLQTIKTNLMQLISHFQTAGARIILTGMIADDRWGLAYRQGFDALYPALAAKYDLPLYPYFLEGAANDPVYMQEGGLHPNASGVRVIVSHFTPWVERSFDEMRAK